MLGHGRLADAQRLGRAENVPVTATAWNARHSREVHAAPLL